MKEKIIVLLMLVTMFSGVCATEVFAAKKKYSVTDRQVELRKKVEVGQQKNELTAKEATGLNGDLDDITASIEKMKSNNAGKLSYKDEGKIEKRLNKISVTLTKKELTKRVTPH